MYAKVNSDGKQTTVELHVLKELEGVTIKSLSTRYGQAFAVAQDGGVYAWGMRTGDPNRPEWACSMGFAEITMLLQPTALPCFGITSQIRIRNVSTGVSHSLFVSDAGEVYAVGQTDSGRLGLGFTEQQQVNVPIKVQFSARKATHCVATAAGARHSLFLASDGTVFGCGAGASGELPTTTRLDNGKVAWLPRLLDRLPCFCTSVAAGIALSLFVSEGGRVYISGTARQTPTPFGRPTCHSPNSPWCVPGLQNVEQVSISMELTKLLWEHAMFSTSKGQVFAWGHMGHGEFSSGMQGCDGFCNAVVPVEVSIGCGENL